MMDPKIVNQGFTTELITPKNVLSVMSKTVPSAAILKIVQFVSLDSVCGKTARLRPRP